LFENIAQLFELTQVGLNLLVKNAQILGFDAAHFEPQGV
jgi:hypothetical protein